MQEIQSVQPWSGDDWPPTVVQQEVVPRCANKRTGHVTTWGHHSGCQDERNSSRGGFIQELYKWRDLSSRHSTTESLCVCVSLHRFITTRWTWFRFFQKQMTRVARRSVTFTVIPRARGRDSWRTGSESSDQPESFSSELIDVLDRRWPAAMTSARVKPVTCDAFPRGQRGHTHTLLERL